MEAPHIFQTPEVFEKWRKAKTALFALAALARPCAGGACAPLHFAS
jgi:hypothetical protein